MEVFKGAVVSIVDAKCWEKLETQGSVFGGIEKQRVMS